MGHHAYYIEGPRSLFWAYKKKLQPFWASEFDRFGIEDARALIQLASLKNFDKTIFFIAITSITTEAQQALLKLFEEPQRGTVFVLLVPHGALLATLRSRCLPYPENLKDRAGAGNAAEFLSEPYAMRSAMIAELLDEEEGVGERVRDFLNALETTLYERPRDSFIREGLHDIAKIRSYLNDRAPSYKMLLEHLAATLPKL